MQMLVKRLADTTRSSGQGRGPRLSPSCRCRTGLEAKCPSPSAWPMRWRKWAAARRCLDCQASDQTAEWFNSFEAAHDVVFYRGDAPDSPWTHLCLRQADRIFPVGARRPAIAASSARICRPSRSAPRACPSCCCCIPRRQRRTAGPFLGAQRPVRIPSPYPRRQSGGCGAGGALHRRPCGGAGAGGRRRAGLRPYRHHQGAEGGRRALRSSGRHLNGRDHRRGLGA